MDRSPGFRPRSLHICQGLRPRRTGHALALARIPVLPSAHDNGVGVPIDSFVAQWLAYRHPCRRFAPGLTADDARLGADGVRYSFIVVDWRHLLLADLPAHCHRNWENPSRLAAMRSFKSHKEAGYTSAVMTLGPEFAKPACNRARGPYTSGQGPAGG